MVDSSTMLGNVIASSTIKRSTLSGAHTMSTTEIPAGPWVIDPSHSEVGFSVRHLMVSKVKGNFHTFEGTITIGENPLDSSVTASVELDSISTRDEGRDAHLRSADFFETETHPRLTFASTSVIADGDDFKVTGD